MSASKKTHDSPPSAAVGAVRQLACADLRPHPQAALLPPLSGEQRHGLRAEIETNGIRVPVAVTSAGTVLDGHLRLALAIELGMARVPAVVVDPADELEYLVCTNIHRRHLSAGQRAALALELESIQQAQLAAKARSRANLNGQERVEVADLPARGRTRDQAAELAGVGVRTIQNVAAVREAAPDLYAEVKSGSTSADKAYRLAQQRRRDAELGEPPPMPTAPAGVILADPAWPLDGDPGSNRAIQRHYPTMTIEAIKALEVPAAPDAVLYLWTVPGLLQEGLDVLSSWGFRYVDQIVWDKEIIGMGSWTRHRHELLLIGVRGNFKPPPCGRRIPSVIRSRRGRHSAKPLAIHEAIERMYPNVPKLELFARGKPRPGWSIWGNQAETGESGG